MCRQVGLQVMVQLRDIGADHEAHVHGGLGHRRYCIHRVLRVAADHGQHFQCVPGDHALGGRQAGLAPIGVDLGVAGVAAEAKTDQRGAHVGRDGWWAQRRHADDATAVHQAGDGVGQHRAGVLQQPAPIAAVVRAFAQLQREVEVHRAARTQEHRGAVAAQARAVAGDQHVGTQRLALRRAEGRQAGAAGFFAGFQQPLHVEAQAPTLLQHQRQRRQVDAVLALVVGRAAAVQAFAVPRQLPRSRALLPAGVLAADDIAVAVDQHRGQRIALVARGRQERPETRLGVVVQRDGEAQPRQRRAHLVGQVGQQCRAAGRVLAFGADGNAARQVLHEGAAVEVVVRGAQGRFTQGRCAHGRAAQVLLTSSKCSTTGAVAKNGPTMARHSAKSGPWRKATVWSSSVSQKICSM